jgi:opacity protein-like surface antigen
MATLLSCGKRQQPALLVSLLLLILGLSQATPSRAVDFAAGVAFPRGFYENALGGQAEFNVGRGFLPSYLSPVVKLSVYVASRDKVSLAVGSGSLLLEARAPGSVSNALGFSPYVAAGPSFNYLYSWVDLEDFGTLSNSDVSTTLSVFAGVEFFPASRVSLFGEARQTIPSEFTFDYVIVGLKFHGPRLPSIE